MRAALSRFVVMAFGVLAVGVLAGGNLWAQETSSKLGQQERVRAAMQASLEKQRASAVQQRESVERQMAGAHRAAGNPVSAGYFIPMDAPYVVIQPILAAMPGLENRSGAGWNIASVGAASVEAWASLFAPQGSATSASWPPPCPPLSDSFLTPLISAAAETYEVDPAVVREVARQESAFRPCSVSSKGAQGLMQLMPETQRMLEVRNPFDPQENIFAGTRLLGTLLERYGGDLAMALGAYNAGTSRVDAVGGIPRIPETQSYVANILGRLGTLPD